MNMNAASAGRGCSIASRAVGLLRSGLVALCVVCCMVLGLLVCFVTSSWCHVALF
jgi:hypothetical protein